MKQEVLTGLASGLLLVGIVEVANADLIGYASTVFDTDTNLEWCTLTETTGFSYNQMLANFIDTNSRFYGYSYATTSDLYTLWNNAGYTGDFYNETTEPANVTAITYLYTLFGQTGTRPVNRADALYDDGDGESAGTSYLVPEYKGYSVARIFTDSSSPDDVNWSMVPGNNMGSWVHKSSVPTPVPEPTTLLLVGTGLCCLVGSRLRKKKREDASPTNGRDSLEQKQKVQKET